MARIEKLALEDWDPELRAMTQADDCTPLEQGLMRMFAHCPEQAKGFVAFAGSLRMNRNLPDRLVELVRLRVAFHNQCRSCMAIRYTDGRADGVTEDLVCSLDNPPAADDLSDAEKAAIDYGERLATNHLSIDDAVYDKLRQYFSEPEIVELGMTVALFVGFGRLAASFAMTEELPESFRDLSAPATPWGNAAVEVR
ncbi:MAG: carboxymuconolactone decarboxylase family protein [Congregibacter sp.]|nr:carboxymuconolactone decarboxylase family protein [Congregibacter sp.]